MKLQPHQTTELYRDAQQFLTRFCLLDYNQMARWRSGQSVSFVVGSPGVHSPCQVITKD